MGNCRDCKNRIMGKNEYGNHFSRGCDRLSECFSIDDEICKRELWEPDFDFPEFIEENEMTV